MQLHNPGGASIDLASPGAIGGTTPAAGTFTGLSVAQGTLTDPATGLNLTATWNDVADTFTAALINVTDTASASGSILLDAQVGGASVWKVGKNGYTTYTKSGTTFALGTDDGYTLRFLQNAGEKATLNNAGNFNTAGGFSVLGSAGVTAGPYTTITSITVKGGIITAISGS